MKRFLKRGVRHFLHSDITQMSVFCSFFTFLLGFDVRKCPNLPEFFFN